MNFKRNTLLLSTCLFFSSLLAQNVEISTPKTTLLLSAPVGGSLNYLYYGSKLSPCDLDNIKSSEPAQYSAYPVYGMNCQTESALAVKHGDGNMSLEMEVVKVSTNTEQDGDVTIIELKDKVYPFFIDLYYKTLNGTEVIETWTELRHKEKKPVTLNRFLSAYLPIRRGDVWVSHLSGSWANEGKLTQEPLTPGLKMIKNKE